VKKQDLVAFAERPWQLLAEAGTANWVARKRELGPAEGLHMAAALRALVVAQRPEWPAAAERTADLEVHARLGGWLRRVTATAD
jgi:hypothetical protein